MPRLLPTARLVVPLAAFAVFVLAAYAPPADVSPEVEAVADTTWSWPEEPLNLQVLPADTTPERLREVMRGFTRSLGVRCQQCHVGEEGADFLTWDFASDAKPMKTIARGMMEMTWQINTQTLPAIDSLATSDDWRVTCWTCHRGETTPDS